MYKEVLYTRGGLRIEPGAVGLEGPVIMVLCPVLVACDVTVTTMVCLCPFFCIPSNNIFMQ